MKSIIVVIADSHLGFTAKVVDKLKTAGLDVDQVLDLSGIVTGLASEELIESIRLFPEICDVTIEK